MKKMIVLIIIWMIIMMVRGITCKVECQECGLDFFMLARAVDLEKKEPLVFVASSTSPSFPAPLPFTIGVSVSARGLPSLPFPSTRERFRENINITLLASNQAESHITTFSVWLFPSPPKSPHISSHNRWIRV